MKPWIPLPLLLLAVAACSGPSSMTIPKGQWGGRNMELIVDDAGASGAFKCGAKGRLDQPLTLDDSGAFDLPGTYDPVLVRGGPRPARYSGTLSGSTLQVSVTVEGTAVGTFELGEGRSASFDVCNF